MEDPQLITAWATVAIAAATIPVGGSTCFVIWRGIVEMHRSSEDRARDRREAREADLRRHKEAMDEGLRHHEKAMTALRTLNKEAVDEGRRRHEEAMTALRALIALAPAVGDGSSAA